MHHKGAGRRGWIGTARESFFRPFGWRRSRRLARSASAIGKDLAVAGASMEPGFIAIGRSFRPLARQMHALLANWDHLVATLDAAQGGRSRLDQAMALLNEPLEFVSTCSRRGERLLDLLARCAERTRAMLQSHERLRTALAPLAFVETLFRVESAGLDLDERETFAAVSADIARLRNVVDESFTRNNELLAGTHAALAAVQVRLAQDFGEHARRIGSERSRIDSALAQLRRQLSREPGSDGRAQAVGRELADQISALVVALQAHDILQQRTDHVVAALAAAGEGGTAAGEMVRLQAAQLQAVHDDLGATCNEIERRIESVARQAQSGGGTTGLDSLGRLLASANGMVQVLADSLSQVRTMLDDSVRLIVGAAESARPAGEISRQLNSALEALAKDMRLIALNAQVRSVHISGVTGLEILAARTAEISMTITTTSRDMVIELRRLSEAADELFALFSELRTQGEACQARLDREQPALAAGLRQLREQAASAYRTVSDTIAAVRAAARESRGEVPLLRSAHHAIGGALSRLRALLAAAGGRRRRLRPSRLAWLQGFAAHYTMESEREVHAAVLGDAGAASACGNRAITTENTREHARSVVIATGEEQAFASHPGREPASEADDLGANVELF